MFVMSRSRRKYTPEYRVEAARLVTETGRSVAVVAGEIGVDKSLLWKWVKAEKERNSDSGELTPEQAQVEISRLRKQVAELKIDNEFLSKASAFFAAKQHERRNTN
ncbi:transposase [Corynebacterium phocae]|uniref:Transposase n=1 Tax=Corynebacterium phocae TaxID=161895 RepID=A0A1L7D0N8_9CORY|nr:transposase [Corynebacterium phocae]